MRWANTNYDKATTPDKPRGTAKLVLKDKNQIFEPKKETNYTDHFFSPVITCQKLEPDYTSDFAAFDSYKPTLQRGFSMDD